MLLMDRNLAFLEPIVKRAGQIIKESSQKQVEVTAKEGLGNYVTEVDMKVEKFLMDSIRSQFAYDSILSEETGESMETPLERDHLWVIDPLDGTSNFVFKRNLSFVFVAYVEMGIIKMGMVYDPFNEELYTAEKGKGSFLNGVQLTLPKRSQDHRLIISTDNSYRPGTIHKHLSYIQRLDSSPHVSIRGSAALALCWVASGKIDIYFHTEIQPWDIAAAMLVVREAGGVFLDLDGKNADILSPGIIAGEKQLVTQVLNQFAL